MDELMEDIQEVLTLARRQAVLPPVRIARILAGEGTGQFSSDTSLSGLEKKTAKKTVPLSVALDYVGSILEESHKTISRLQSEVGEYNELCNSMESEIDSLLRASNMHSPVASRDSNTELSSRLDIDQLYAKVRAEDVELDTALSDQPREAFWREMKQSEESFDTIARFFAQGVIN